jgi:hypothetical protein
MDVALWIPIFLLKDQIIPFLDHASSPSSMIQSQTFRLEYEFSRYSQNTLRYHVEPSFIQHIGLYPEDPLDKSKAWVMDPRFMLDPGLYQQGLDFFCKDETDGSWYQYEFPVDCDSLPSSS